MDGSNTESATNFTTFISIKYVFLSLYYCTALLTGIFT